MHLALSRCYSISVSNVLSSNNFLSSKNFLRFFNSTVSCFTTTSSLFSVHDNSLAFCYVKTSAQVAVAASVTFHMLPLNCVIQLIVLLLVIIILITSGYVFPGIILCVLQIILWGSIKFHNCCQYDMTLWANFLWKQVMHRMATFLWFCGHYVMVNSFDCFQCDTMSHSWYDSQGACDGVVGFVENFNVCHWKRLCESLKILTWIVENYNTNHWRFLCELMKSFMWISLICNVNQWKF